MAQIFPMAPQHPRQAVIVGAKPRVEFGPLSPKPNVDRPPTGNLDVHQDDLSFRRIDPDLHALGDLSSQPTDRLQILGPSTRCRGL
jgi:hypothetical protein